MYAFVFSWTPALATPETRSTLPYGVIFSTYMVWVMIGSSAFSWLQKQGLEVERIPYILHGLAAAANVVPFLMPNNKPVIFFAFLVFEVCGCCAVARS
jgi:hypothetical protein